MPLILPVFKDLIKPQWVAVLEELKLSGGLPASELSKRLEVSYMAAKQHCEELHKIGYLDRSRVPRTLVGRPEIFYSLTGKADGLFPDAGVGFSIDLLDATKALFGESTPDKLLFQYFHKLETKWHPVLAKSKSLVERATKLASLREKEGGFVRCGYDPECGFRIEEFHNPLQRILDRYPRAVAMELRIIEQLLGTKVTRREVTGGRPGQPKVIFEVPTLGNP